LAFRAYFTWYVASFYIIILVIFIFCYGRILIAIRRQASVMAGHTHSAAGSNTTQTQSHQIQFNVIKTMILVSTFYVIAWGPSGVYYFQLWLDHSNLIISDRSYYHASIFIGFLYTSANPFIYATKFNPVRKVLKDMIPCMKPPVQPTSGPGITTSRINRRPNVIGNQEAH